MIRNYTVFLKDAATYFQSANEEMMEMVETIVRGLLDEVSDDDIYEGCCYLAEPIFGEFYHEYVFEVVAILKSGLIKEEFNLIKHDWKHIHGFDCSINVNLVESDYISITVESHEINSNNAHTLPAIRINSRIQPSVRP